MGVRSGRPVAVGFLGLARLLPGALALPFGAWAADRFSRRHVVTAVFVAMSVTQAVIAVALATEAPAVAVYALVAAEQHRRHAVPVGTSRVGAPGRQIAGGARGDERDSGNARRCCHLRRTPLAALLLLRTDPWFVVLAASVAAAVGCIAVSGIRVDVDPSKAVRRTRERPLEALIGGITELRKNTDAAIVVGCFVSQLLVRGFLTVLLVSISFDLLGLGSSGVGWLAAIIGIGGITGGFYAVVLTRRRKLGQPFAAALTMWGLPIALIGLVSEHGRRRRRLVHDRGRQCDPRRIRVSR